MKFRRMEIWWVDFKGEDYLIQGIHPAVIIKEWRQLTKIGKGIENIEVLPITSKPPKKTLQTQVFIKNYNKYGLDKPSYVMCEQIRQISSKDVIIKPQQRKFGKVNPLGQFDKKIEKEINDKIARQLQIDHRYPEYSEEDFDFNNLQTYETDKYLKLYNKFIKAFEGKEYNKALNICENQILKEVNTFGYGRNIYLYKTYYNIGLCYLKLDDRLNALMYAKKSLTYMHTNKVTESYARVMFLILRCKNNNDEFCYENYKKLTRYYRMINNKDMKTLCIFNMCMIKRKYNLCRKIYYLNKNITNKLILSNMKEVLDRI